MAVVTYKHPETGQLRKFNDDDAVRVAALKKLGFVQWTADDVENDEKPSVTYEQVTPDTPAKEAPALPKLTRPIPPGPTKDTSTPAKTV